MTYTAMATFQHQNPFTLGADAYAGSDGDGTNTTGAELSF